MTMRLRATAHATMPPHRMRHACSARCLIKGSSLRAREMASELRKPLVSSDHRPPTSTAKTTKSARRPGPKNFGQVPPSLRELLSKLLHHSSRPPVSEPHLYAEHTPICYRNLRATLALEDRRQRPRVCDRMSVWCRDVHVSHHDVRAHTTSCFSANARHDALKCKPPSTEHPRCGASCTMVATRIKWTATSATAHRERKCKAKTSEQNNSEKVGWDARLPIGGGHCQCRPCTWSSLRPDQCLRLIWNAGEHKLGSCCQPRRVVPGSRSSGSLVGGRACKKGVAGSPLSSATKWGIEDADGLSNWLGSQGFPLGTTSQPELRSSFCTKPPQETVALLECVYVLITLQHGREGVVPIQQTDVRPAVPRSRVAQVGEIPSASWEQLDQVNLDDVFLHRVPMMKSCPRFLRGRLRFCFGLALRERHRAKSAVDRDAEIRAWTLFGLIPLLLFHRTKHSGKIGRDELAKNADDVSRGEWVSLLTVALPAQRPHSVQPREPRNEQERRGAAAMSRVKRGQVSRGRHELTGASLAPKNDETRAELQGRRPQVRQNPIPQDVIDHQPESPLQLDGKVFSKCLRTAPSGSSPGNGGCTNEMLRVYLDDTEGVAGQTHHEFDLNRHIHSDKGNGASILVAFWRGLVVSSPRAHVASSAALDEGSSPNSTKVCAGSALFSTRRNTTPVCPCRNRVISGPPETWPFTELVLGDQTSPALSEGEQQEEFPRTFLMENPTMGTNRGKDLGNPGHLGFGPPILGNPLLARQTALRRTAQNFALFPSPAPIFVLFFSLSFSLTVCLLVEFWWCF